MATGNKLVKEITDQFLHCKICYEPYREPKTLSCLHTFCSDCIQKHVDSDSNRSSRFLLYSRFITCPLCRSKTEIPTGGIRRLPDNFLVSSLTDVLDRKKVGKVPPCEICPGERIRANNPASHKCLDCAKLLCKSCVNLHSTTKVTQHHSLIDIEGEKDIECKTHPEEIVRYYCEPCEECICVVCTFQEHRDHEICSFSDGFSKYKSGLDTLLTKCKDRLSAVEDRLTDINTVESTLKETRENIRDLAISYIAQVRQTERQLMQRVEEDFGTKAQSYLQNKEWLQENFEGLKTTCNLAEIIMNDRGVEMLLLKKELQDKLSALLEPSLPSVPDDLSQKIKFVPGNVKLGHISWNSQDDADCDGGSIKHHLPETEEPPTKRQCVTRDTQTESESTISPVANSISFEVPITNFSQGTPLMNGFYRSDITTNLDKDVSSSKTDVSVNTMCSSDDLKMGGVCVKCSAELKKDYGSSSSLPVIDGTPPTIQDIIITNCSTGDLTGQRRRRSLIKSRRVQTDISLSNESLDEVFSPAKISSQESLNGSFRKLSQNSLMAVAECTITTSIGLDPIDIPADKPIKPEVSTKTKGVNTTENVKVIPDSRSMKTNTDIPTLRESATMTYPDNKTRDTQTRDKISVHKAVATDYAGQRNKRTSTPIIITMDSCTHMPPLTQESKTTWTDTLQTTERSICTEQTETSESATETMKPSLSDQGVVVKPEVKTIETNTDPVQFADTVDAAATGAKPKEKKSKTKDKEKKEKSSEKKSKEKKEKREKKKYADSCVETDPVIRSDKETGTSMPKSQDAWTATYVPELINTGISPSRPATREASIATNPVVSIEQGTYTEVVKMQDSATESGIVICDGETLTERIGYVDAQTSADLFLQNVETLTDKCYVTETGCMTDAEWFWDSDRDLNVVVCDVCQEKRAFVDTATSPMESSEIGVLSKPASLKNTQTQTNKAKLYDKSNMTSCDYEDIPDQLKGLGCCDVSTSTENLPYIGLLSDMECDELILVPEIAIDVIGSDAEYQKAYTNSFPINVREASAQTIISSETMCDTVDGDITLDMLKAVACDLITIGVNTEQTLTFEKETCTPNLHRLSQGTNTTQHEKFDKATSTGNYVRAIQESFCGSPVPVLKHPKLPKKDVCVETDSALMDEKMIACINKLKTVSERLNSPTSKMFAETMPWVKKSDSDESENSDGTIKDAETCNTTEVEKKKITPEVAAKPQTVSKPKDAKTEPVRRKAQPLTTLKAKYMEKSTDNDKKSPVNRRDSTDSTSSTSSSKNGSQTPLVQRKVSNTNGSRRSTSTPGRIATVPNQSSLRKTPSPATQPKSVTNKSGSPKQEAANKSTTSAKSSSGPDFYSTVPKTRHPKHGLSSISENNRHSSGSDLSAITTPKPTSTSSLDKSLDFSSLKIQAPPRAPSVSPTPTRHTTKHDNGRSARPKTASTPVSRLEVAGTADGLPDMRSRTGSTSSDQTDNEPSQEKKGFMKKLFGSKKKKSSEKRNASPSKSPKPGRKALVTTPAPPPPESPAEKPKEKPKPFVYMRSRIFSIEQKDEDKYNKPIVNKYCVNKEDEEKPPVFDFAATFTKKK
ncbi:hypothetical protein ACF0H5_008115 [Mactra antiquata]